MSCSGPGPLRLLSFGDATSEIWGAAVQAGDRATLVMTPHGATSTTGAGQVRIEGGDTSWRVAATGVALTFAPVGGPPHEPSGAGDALCHVEGRVTLPEGQREISCPGTVSLLSEPEVGRLDSIRALTGWFAENRGVALRALRLDDKKGHDRDVVAATLFDTEEWVTVTDPRLSTTFRPGERPARASLELWVGEGEEVYPRRVAAEAVGRPSEADRDRLRVSLTPLLCHAGGLDGTGVYLIAHL